MPPPNATAWHALSRPRQTIERSKSSARLAFAFTLLCTLCALFCARSYAVPAGRWARLTSPVFGHINTKNGLPSDTLGALAQGSDGFVWIGTQSGLVRYDGYRFRTFNYDSQDKTSIPGDYVQVLFSDRAGNLWVGTATGGIARLDREHERFVRFGEGEDGQSGRNITAITGDGANGIWIGTEHEIEHRDSASGALERYPGLSADLSHGADASIGGLLVARDGTLWIGSDAGLARWRPGSAHALTVAIRAADSTPPIVDNVAAFFEDAHGVLWFGTSGHGLGTIRDDGQARLFQGSGEAAAELAHQSVHAIREVAPNLLWVATYGGGVFQVELGSGSVTRFHHIASQPDSLGDDQCLDLMQDRSGLVWLATEQGISTADPANTVIETAFADPSRSDQLAEGNIIGLMTDAMDNLWLGYHRGGVDVFDVDGKRVGALHSGNQPDVMLPQRTVSSFAQSAPDTVWIGTSLGLYRTDRGAHGAERVVMPVASAIPFIQVLLADDDQLWVGGNQGLLRYRIGTHSWQVIDVTQGLSDNRVTALVRAEGGELWVATEHGLNRLNAAGRVVEKVQVDGAQRDGLGNDFISDLAWDTRKRLWVGTGGGGIYVMLGRNAEGRARFAHIGAAEGLANSNIAALRADRNGHIWASADGGIALLNPETLRARPYRRADGVVIDNYWNSSSAITGDGSIVFGGIGGITVIHPEEVRPREFRPPLAITEIRLGNTVVPAMHFNEPAASAELSVPPDVSGFEVEFAALDLSSPQDNRYSYRLEGFDSDWIRVDATRRTAAYTNLAPGRYVLRVRGSGRDGTWSTSELALKIRVLPAWYQTWQMYLLEVLGVLVAVALIVRARTGYLYKRHRELEALVQLRTGELSASKKRLEEIAFYDPLTNLPNRRFFAERFDQFRAASDRTKVPFALIIVDLDHFKAINDRFGHDAGDKVLVETAQRLRNATREVDCVTRLGGDEFAILLDNASHPGMLDIVCDRVIAALARPIELAGVSYPLSGTIGAAIYPRHGTTQETLYKAADIVLYQAKAAGRNAWRVAHDPGRTVG